MSETSQRPSRVGVRELRQNLSIYLDRVKDGERLVVTEHGQPVAELTPLTRGSVSVLERLIAEGRARPANGDLSQLGIPGAIAELPGAATVTDMLLQLRDEERW